MYEVKGYSSGALIAAPSLPEPNGYRLYAVRDKNPNLFKALEPGKSNKAPKQLQLLTLSADAAVPLRTLDNGAAAQFLDMLKRSTESEPVPELDESWSRYAFVLDTGDSIGYYAKLYRKDDQLHWSSDAFRRMPIEAMLFVNQPRETVIYHGW